MPIKCIKFPEPYQYLTVAAGKTKRVWYMPVTGKQVAFIDQIACDWFANTWLEFIVDGAPVEPKIEREIPFTTPKEFNPPIVARKSIKWFAHNEDTDSHVFGVLCDGSLCKQKT